MMDIGRRISLLGRRRDAAKDGRRVLTSFAQWRAVQAGLPPAQPRPNTLLLVRLDDIGDYLLFRNQLAMYKRSGRWAAHRITLLGNESWRDLHTWLDGGSVDDAIWVNKNRYLYEDEYRLGIWRALRERGFDTVIAPSCTRPLLLDDLCTLAAAPMQAIGSVNTNVHDSWNRLSDGLYTSLFVPARPLMHEFRFNGDFAEWVCGQRFVGLRPYIDLGSLPPASDLPEPGSYVICFVGASTRSRRWPVKRWIEFIDLLRRRRPGAVYLAGNGGTELAMVEQIQRRTGCASIAGQVTLSALLHWVAGATAVVSNDTMAAHMSASFDRPTVIVANGINYMRFSDYRGAGIEHVATLYPEVFNRHRRRFGDGPYRYSDTVTADIASIRAETVLGGLQALLPPGAR